MNIDEYLKQSSRTDAPINGDILDRMINNANNIHSILGMLTEVGELADQLKKHIFYGKPYDKVNMSEEIGDVMWYMMKLCRDEGFDFGNILNQNIEKLKARFPQKFTESNAIVRNLEKERTILENHQ